MNKPSIYAALRVPEVWRYNGSHIEVLVLQPSGSYATSPTSIDFANFAPRELERFLDMYPALLDSEIVAAFRKWLRDQRG